MSSRVLSIQAGLPQTLAHDENQAPWRSGVFKSPLFRPVFVSIEGLEGDGRVADVHAGPDRAVLGYSAEHYPLWRSEFPQFDFPSGSFGENLTIAGLNEDSVCIGDVWELGDVRLQVSLPRSPCATLNRRCGIESLLSRVVETGRIGWLYRVLQEGLIAPGQPLTLQDRPLPQWSVATTFTTMRQIKAKNPAYLEAALQLADCAGLAPSWQAAFRREAASMGDIRPAL